MALARLNGLIARTQTITGATILHPMIAQEHAYKIAIKIAIARSYPLILFAKPFLARTREDALTLAPLKTTYALISMLHIFVQAQKCRFGMALLSQLKMLELAMSL
jgi:hypothetical protein